MKILIEKAVIEQALEASVVAEGFVDRHSEDWYISGQQDLKQIREAITALREALAEQAEQEPVLMPVRRGTRITCMESDETCVVWTTSDTHAWVQFPDGQIGKYTYEQIGSYFSLDKNYATDEAYERGLKEGIEAGKKIAEQAEQEPVFNADDLYSIAGRLALELECLLMDTKDMSVVSKWWDSAHEALEQWRSFHSAPVQPVKQEPVAEVVSYHEAGLYDELPIGTLLYAAPVRTKDLTDDEIETIFEYWYSQPETKVWSTVDLARAVIAADRKLNGVEK